MESLIRNVRDIPASDRQALEHVLGHVLQENQQLIIQVINVDASAPAEGDATDAGGALPEWCNVYQGLSDEQVQDLEQAILPRADFTRPTP